MRPIADDPLCSAAHVVADVAIEGHSREPESPSSPRNSIETAERFHHWKRSRAPTCSPGYVTVRSARGRRRLSPQRQSRRRQIIRAAKLADALAALFEHRQPLRALGRGPVNPRSRLRRSRHGYAHRCIRHQAGPSR